MLQLIDDVGVDMGQDGAWPSSGPGTTGEGCGGMNCYWWSWLWASIMRGHGHDQWGNNLLHTVINHVLESRRV
jgi:hypothetical protein